MKIIVRADEALVKRIVAPFVKVIEDQRTLIDQQEQTIRLLTAELIETTKALRAMVA